jgi:hypothetical protein
MAKLSPVERRQLIRAASRRPEVVPRLRRLTMPEYVDFITQTSRMIPRQTPKPIMGGDHWKL